MNNQAQPVKTDFPYSEGGIRNMTNDEIIRVVQNYDGIYPAYVALELSQRLEASLYGG